MACRREPTDYEPFPDVYRDPDGILARWLEVCQIVPLWGQEWECTAAWHQAPRRFPEVFYYWVEAGHGWYRLGGAAERCGLRPGDLLMVPPMVLHEVGPERGVRMKLYTAHFHARVYETVDLTSLLGMAGAFPEVAGAPYRRAAPGLAREYALQAPGWKMAMASAVREILLFIIRHHGSRLSVVPRSGRQTAIVRLQPVFDLIRDRLGEPNLKVAELAARLSVSEVYLRKLFRSAVRMSPVEFVRRRRIDRACTLLRTTELTTEAVADRCGFSDPAFFFRTFRGMMATTPSAYRRVEDV
ncbi:MAG: helix-turn-helix transcriptional regulator [Kiritimatiellae bacterium]|nr:helix-turn-helix transcriptional regulator [Kiritimatiellia bacterium]